MQEEEGVSHWAQVVVISPVEKLLKSNIETVRSKKPIVYENGCFLSSASGRTSVAQQKNKF